MKPNKISKYYGYSSILAGIFILVFAFTARAAVFNRNLSQGSTGTDVKQLQQYLNGHNFPLAQSGPGSPGRETSYFGPLLKAALIKFQDFFAAEILQPLGLTQGTGIFSNSTRNFINLRLASPTTTPAVTPLTLKFGGYPQTFRLPATTWQNNVYGDLGGGGGGGVVPATQAPLISFNDIFKTFGDAAFSPSPTSNSGGLFSYTSSNPAVAAASGGTITIAGAGTTTITAIEASSGQFASGSATATLTVNKKVPNLTWSNFNLPMITVAEEETGNPFPLTFSVNPTSDSPGAYFLYAGDPALFSVDPASGNGTALQDLNPNITPSYTITIAQNATANFTAASTTAVVTPVDPNDCSPNPCQYGGTCASPKTGYSFGGFTCTCAAGMQGLTCNSAIDACSDFPCQNGGTCTRVSTLGGVNPPLNSYTCSCTSGFGGTNCETVLNPPTINFSVATTTTDAAPFTISASSTSSGSFTFTSSSSSVATISGNTVTVHGVGLTTITATQAPDGIYSTGTQTTTLAVGLDVCTIEAPCENGGACTNIYPEDYTCSCSSPYSGTLCEKSDTICNADYGTAPCLNLGTCTPTTFGGECSCQGGWIGPQCEDPTVNASAYIPPQFIPASASSCQIPAGESI
ncbi:MAG: peptidoglycan-binding protein [Candidatus Doudnabacteria bacterium]|nr:peptidoglycan-binding protein [Candidatus Doudnabacteria bacterium]